MFAGYAAGAADVSAPAAQVQAVTSTLSANAATLGNSVTTLGGNVGYLAALSGTGAQISNLHTLTSQLADANLSGLNSTLDGLIRSGSLTNVQHDSVTRLYAQVSTLSSTLSNNNINGSISSVAHGVSQLSSLARNVATLQSAGGQISSLSSNVNGLASNNILSGTQGLAALSGMQSLGTNVATLNSSVVAVNGNVAHMSGQIASLSNFAKADLNSMANTVNVLTGKLSSTGLNNLTSRLGDVNTLSSLIGNVNYQFSNVTSLSQQMGSVNAMASRIDNISNASMQVGTLNGSLGNVNDLNTGLSNANAELNIIQSLSSGDGSRSEILPLRHWASLLSGTGSLLSAMDALATGTNTASSGGNSTNSSGQQDCSDGYCSYDNQKYDPCPKPSDSGAKACQQDTRYNNMCPNCTVQPRTGSGQQSQGGASVQQQQNSVDPGMQGSMPPGGNCNQASSLSAVSTGSSSCQMRMKTSYFIPYVSSGYPFDWEYKNAGSSGQWNGGAGYNNFSNTFQFILNKTPCTTTTGGNSSSSSSSSTGCSDSSQGGGSGQGGGDDQDDDQEYAYITGSNDQRTAVNTSGMNKYASQLATNQCNTNGNGESAWQRLQWYFTSAQYIMPMSLGTSNSGGGSGSGGGNNSDPTIFSSGLNQDNVPWDQTWCQPFTLAQVPCVQEGRNYSGAIAASTTPTDQDQVKQGAPQKNGNCYQDKANNDNNMYDYRAAPYLKMACESLLNCNNVQSGGDDNAPQNGNVFLGGGGNCTALTSTNGNNNKQALTGAGASPLYVCQQGQGPQGSTSCSGSTNLNCTYSRMGCQGTQPPAGSSCNQQSGSQSGGGSQSGQEKGIQCPNNQNFGKMCQQIISAIDWKRPGNTEQLTNGGKSANPSGTRPTLKDLSKSAYERIWDPSHPFSPRFDFSLTDRYYSHLPDLDTLLTGQMGGHLGDGNWDIGYVTSNSPGAKDYCIVRCAAVPVDILHFRQKEWDACMRCRINVNTQAFWVEVAFLYNPICNPICPITSLRPGGPYCNNDPTAYQDTINNKDPTTDCWGVANCHFRFNQSSNPNAWACPKNDPSEKVASIGPIQCCPLCCDNPFNAAKTHFDVGLQTFGNHCKGGDGGGQWPPCSTKYDHKQDTAYVNPNPDPRACPPLQGNSIPSYGQNYMNASNPSGVVYDNGTWCDSGSNECETISGDSGTVQKCCDHLAQPLFGINTLKLSNTKDHSELLDQQHNSPEGYLFKSYFGNHKPYMAWWDCGGEGAGSKGQRNYNPDSDKGQYDTVVGVGKPGQRSGFGGGGGISITSGGSGGTGGQQGGQACIYMPPVDAATSWAELVQYQAKAMREYGLMCLPQYEKVHKTFGPENSVLNNCGYFLKRTQNATGGYDNVPTSYPCPWAGYLSDTDPKHVFPIGAGQQQQGGGGR